MIEQGKKNQLKVVLLGETGVGKSSLAHRFAFDKFSECYEATIGAGYFEKPIPSGSGSIKLCIWDTAGQERFASLASFYYRGCQIALVVFDLSKKQTFERAKAWINELQANAPVNVVIYLVGNKSDLNQREVTTEHATSYAKDLGILYIEVSAKTNANISELFVNAVKYVPCESLCAEKEDYVKLKEKGQESGERWTSCGC
eukprot:TRINITY_DN11265_c0_g1_i18.p1 TRINITY_DN11265_c0_g1~~TRINITY_DN11265_c0_g1_i18.p1  ORF type:complete len:201 (+),score=57.07 TRINITY_DN11265_c0_g1_i18:164-766(+)